MKNEHSLLFIGGICSFFLMEIFTKEKIKVRI